MRPEFVDNRDGNTLGIALRDRLKWLRENLRVAISLDIASGYFNPEGFRVIADELEQVPRVRLLLGAEPVPPIPRRRRRLDEARGPRFQEESFRAALGKIEHGLLEDRDVLGFTQEIDATLRRLVEYLHAGKIEVRRYEKAFLHGKAFIFRGDDGLLSGSSNFTAAGLMANLELNLGHYQPSVVERVASWFESLWEEATPYDLASIYDARLREYDPYVIYLRVLWERYGSELEQDRSPEGKIRLTTFQNDGLGRASRILEQYNGVVIADGVGLGKTFLAGALLEDAVDQKRQRALLISPAALRDGTWRQFAARHGLYIENVSFEQLAADPTLGGTGKPCLAERPERYSLIVVDEAHAFRNPETDRARALRHLIRGTPPKKLVLMSATPVNNSLWDLYYLLTLFVGHDARFADLGVPSLKGRFDAAMREDPFDLKPDVLFDLLDQVVVRRTRRFVVRHYPNDTVRLPDGSEARIRFPDPHVRKLVYDLDAVLPGFFDDFADAIAPASGDPKLTLARYVPSAYRKKGQADASQHAIAGLLRAALLKRFESSACAFAKTAEAMCVAHDRFLAVLQRGFVPTPELLSEWDEDVAADEDLDAMIAEKGAEPARDYDVAKLREDVEADRALLKDFADRANSVRPESDPKLAALTEALLTILQTASKEALTPEQEGDLRKVLIFSYYADTTSWVESYLRDLCDRDKRFAAYRGRIAAVAGQGTHGGVSRERAIFGFAPRSTEAPPGYSDDRFDVLVSTDVLAEGLNLQQCRHIINFDLPWNPMRLVQRHGRIDRIGSHHKDVFIGCFFPERRLDQLLQLEDRLRRKIAQAAASIGLESAPLPGSGTVDVVFAETRKEIDALREERPDLFINAGEREHAHTGEDYRQELRKGMELRGEEVLSLPWAAGSGFARGEQAGHFFCVRVLEKVFLRFVPSDGRPILRDSLTCLRLIASDPATVRYLPAEMLGGVYAAWQAARQDVFDEWMHATDPANLQPKIRPLFREIAAHLRQHPPDDLTTGDIEAILAAIEAPWGFRIERELREVFQQKLSPAEVSAAVCKKVAELGLTPWQAPKPLGLIDADEVHLVCWMTVSKET